MAESDEFCMKIIHFSYFYPDLKPFAYKAVLRAEQFMRRILNCGYLEYFSFEKLSIILQEMDTYYNRVCNTDTFCYLNKNNLFYVTDGGETKVYGVLQWVKHDFEERKKHYSEFLNYLEFDRLTSSSIHNILDEVCIS